MSGGRTRLRRARTQRGWSQNDAAARLYALGIELGVAEADLGVDARQISRWENGRSQPGPLYTALMSRLYDQPPDQLDLPPVVLPVAPVASAGGPAAPVPVPVDATGDEYITVAVKRREFLEAVGGGVVAGMVSNGPLSPAARFVLIDTFSRNIEDAWKLFHTADTERVLAVATAQIHMLRRHHTDVPLDAMPRLSSAAYRLLGATYHRQGRYEDAFRAHDQAYLSALEAADAHQMAESRAWQACGMQTVGRPTDSLALLEAALRLASAGGNPASGQLRGRLLTSSAVSAAALHDTRQVTAMLNAAEALLAELSTLNEEFDRSAWSESAGICALCLGAPADAVANFQDALDEMPIEWLPRRVVATIGLARALARVRDLDATLSTAYELLPQLEAVRSRELADQFLGYLHTDLLAGFPGNPSCLALVAESRSRLAVDD